MATACFMTRALLTTCGKNILPSPNKSPTTFMPSISGPSITSIGRPPSPIICARSSSVSSSMKVVMPWTSACVKRSRTSSSRQAKFSTCLAPPPLNWSAISNKRSVGVFPSFSLKRLRTTSSTRSRNSGSKSAYTPS